MLSKPVLRASLWGVIRAGRSNSTHAFGVLGARLNHSQTRVAQVTDREPRAQTAARLQGWSGISETPTATVEEEEAIPGIMSADEYRKSHEITVLAPKGATVEDPFQSFEDAPAAIRSVKGLLKAFDKPSTIQAQAWPLALNGKDIISIAKTGSGKTLGFLVPALEHIERLNKYARRGDGPSVLILAPTRELATQIEKEAKIYSRLSVLCVYGGVPKGSQCRRLQEGVDIVIATPGRLNDLLSLRPPVTNLNRVSFMVLDEADRMLDMGFEPQLRQILDHMRDNVRQTLMFSATWPKEVRYLASEFLTDPTQIMIGGTGLSVNKDVQQHFHLVDEYEKKEKFDDIISTMTRESSVIVFCNRKNSCDMVAHSIRRTGLEAHSIHGDKSQSDREWSLSQFRAGRAQVIVATDVAARGLDIKGVSHVINMDFPTSGVQDWIHRVGRTGRAGNKGIAITLFSEANDGKHGKELHKILVEAKQEVPDWLSTMAKARGGGSGNGRGRGGGYGGGRNRFANDGGYGGGYNRGGGGYNRGGGGYNRDQRGANERGNYQSNGRSSYQSNERGNYQSNQGGNYQSNQGGNYGNSNRGGNYQSNQGANSNRGGNYQSKERSNYGERSNSSSGFNPFG